jgi:quercetin dioxygenase-like cupin family protein
MSFIDTAKLNVIERLPGWYGCYFDSANMTFGHYEFDAGGLIHEHSHEQEKIWHILEGELDITISGVMRRASAGFVGIIPPNTLHTVKAITSGKAPAVDCPLRKMV